MFIYQTHARTEILAPSNKYPTLLHHIDYALGVSKEEVLSKVIKMSVLDEIYVLRVSEATLMDEIVHCEELVRYWENASEVNQHKGVMIQRQRNLIKKYVDMILESRE
jgi:hypothetical protein